MAYCRFSCDDYRCDLHVYRGDRDNVLLVAGFRYGGNAPVIDWDAGAAASITASKALCRFLLGAERVPIALPHAGEVFHEPDLGALRERMLALRGLGYRFPDDALAMIDAEMAEMAREQEERGDA